MFCIPRRYLPVIPLALPYFHFALHFHGNIVSSVISSSMNFVKIQDGESIAGLPLQC